MTAERAAQTAPLMQESCCAMSDEASQRVPAPTSQSVATATPTTVAVPAWFRGVSVDHSAQPIHTAPQSLDHVPRHLLLSVLIV